MGRYGEGPGELKMARNLHVDDRGNLYLGDVLNARVTVFDSSGALARTIRVGEPQPGFTILSLPGDSLLVEGHRTTPDLWGFSVHVMSPDGERVRSFGNPTYEIPHIDPYYHHRALAWAGSEEVWIGGWHRYYIELWSLAGERIRTFIRDVDWFRFAIPGSGGPRPVVNALQQDSSGLLWVHGRVPAALGVTDAPNGLDPFVEVIDPAAGQVLASVRLRGQSTPFFGNQLIGFLSVDLDSGLVQMVILRARLDVS
jgi:hypothetical protein